MGSSIILRQLLLLLMLIATSLAQAESRVLEPSLRHLRIDGPREWAEFPESPDGARLELHFATSANDAEQTLRLRQQDVKQAWRVVLNDRELGRLRQDEADLILYLPIPPGTLVEGKNTLLIEQVVGPRSTPDDIRIGEIRLESRPMHDVLTEASLTITVTEDEQPIPCRVTLVNADGALQMVTTLPDRRIAVRPGVIYTAEGTATLSLPAGHYTVFAGRGFEYSLATADVMVAPGDSAQLSLSLRREVPTAGWIACDTHLHSLTHSGHGDATAEERVVTVAGEGIELAIATDHNVQVDYGPVANKVGVRRWFTPVTGNEVTTKVGHFNIFPVQAGATPPDHTQSDWSTIFDEIARAGAKVIILNHGRDLHSGFRPLGPEHFNAAVGLRLDGRTVEFNAMEVLNSGATQTDVMRLFHDWMALLNAGHAITPIGASDSHDVARYIVGQGRTYIRGDDSHPATIDVASAIESLLNGHVMVSYGLLVELSVEGQGPGDFVHISDDEIRVEARVLGPHWTSAERIELFMNGIKIREETLSGDLPDLPSGVKWSGGWRVQNPRHDVHFVAIARGPGIEGVYWQTAKPYQPTSPHWNPQVVGSSGAVWVDADGDGRRTAASDYARRFFDESAGDVARLIELLDGSDEAIAAQAAWLHHAAGGSLTDPALSKASPAVRAGFRNYFEHWRQSQTARAAAGE